MIMKLHVIHKGQTVDISYDLLYINTDEVNIRFSNSNAQSCKFLTQYLEANRLDYVLKDREDYKEVVALPDIFALTLSTKGTYCSPVVKDNLYDTIIKRSNDIELAHNAIREFKRNAKIIDAKLVDTQDDLSKSEYARSIDNITKEILEFKRCKQLEALALAEKHLDVPRGTMPTVESEDEDLSAELQEKAAKLAESKPNISEWIREKCRQFGFEFEFESEDKE